MPKYPAANEKINLKDYKKIKDLTGGKTNEVALWQHRNYPELKIVVKTPITDSDEIVNHNIKSINAFLGEGNAWLIKGKPSFAMKYFEGKPLTDEDIKTLPHTMLKSGSLFTILDPNKENYLRLPSGQIIPVDYDYMIVHDDTELLSYQITYLEHRKGFAERVGDASPEEAVQYVLDSYPHAYHYLFQRWGKQYLKESQPPKELENLVESPSIDASTAINAEAITTFTKQLAELAEKAAILAADNHINAAKRAFALYELLDTSFEKYQKGNMTKEVFRETCATEMRIAHKELENHRGWKQVLLNLGLALASLGIGYIAACTANLVRTNGKHFFFRCNTDSINKLIELDKTINQVAPAA
ncbi:hypothetical protein [Legionella cardiaca]|uniref:Ankyrin repeat protein n=1 Tax=Legionella cardiaca TaxID=1071983 RepID=A0ABY8AQI0_9GAMM|nr:hypothetical protein [Legionella cardiaca]WED42948.1 hypothetical protein PXX05_13750 [Legionella cardiaca]